MAQIAGIDARSARENGHTGMKGRDARADAGSQRMERRRATALSLKGRQEKELFLAKLPESEEQGGPYVAGAGNKPQ